MASAGPNSPSAASGWTTSSNVYTSDNNYATASISAGGASPMLLVQGFGFAVPSGASILGITVAIERSAGNSGLVDNTIQLLNGSGTPTGSNKSAGAAWPTSDTVATFGSSSDTWSASLTDTDVNSASFGVQIKCTNSAGLSRTAYVDYVSITVEYSSGQPTQERGRKVPYMRQTRIGW